MHEENNNKTGPKIFLVKSYEDIFIVCDLPLSLQAKDILYDFTVI